MTFWGKNSVIVPLDTLINKEKENTSRPVAARSCGSVGRWGKMGFTSTRTYALKVPVHLSPATGHSPDQIGSPPCANNSSGGPSLSPPPVEPPKPKKFFKSRNTTAPLDFIRSQFMQHHMSHIAPISPGYSLHVGENSICNQTSKEVSSTGLKMKIKKGNKNRRESREPKEESVGPTEIKDNNLSIKERKERQKSTSSIDKPLKSPKPLKKKKEEKLLKPEAPPSRVLGRNRKPVNYNEDDDTIPYRPSEVPTSTKKCNVIQNRSTDSNDESDITNEIPIKAVEEIKITSEEIESKPEVKNKLINKCSVDDEKEEFIENDDNKSIAANKLNLSQIEHPPIVLRISKGTSRLISTDSEDGKLNSTTPIHEPNTDPPLKISINKTETEIQDNLFELSQTKISSTEELLSVLSDDKQEIPIINKKTRKKSTTALTATIDSEEKEEQPAPIIYPADTIPDINYESKISPDKPPKERLKLIIKTDVLRKALAAEAEKAEKKKEKEKNKKHHKHHHHHHHHHKSLTLKITTTDAQFKTPSPQPAVVIENNCDLYKQLAINSPSERDFDSQSSILGSVSSKATTALGQFVAANVPEESCVIRSRGSSDITSDLETSQHSSLVAPPSDIESRLESMMDPEEEPVSTISTNGKRNTSIRMKLIEQEPLKEDILEVLTGGAENESLNFADKDHPTDNIDEKSTNENLLVEVHEKNPVPLAKRSTRNRKNIQEKMDDKLSVEAVQGSSESISDKLSNKNVEVPKITSRSLRLRGLNTIQTQSTEIKTGIEEPLKSPVRRGQKNVKKPEVIEANSLSVVSQNVTAVRSTRNSRSQKTKLTDVESIEPISNNLDKKSAEKRIKKGAIIQQEITETLNKDVVRPEQQTRSSKRNIKSDILSSPNSSPIKANSSSVKNIQNQIDSPIGRRVKTQKKPALNNLKISSENEETSSLNEISKTASEPISSVQCVRSYGSRKRKPQTDVVLSDITPPSSIKLTPSTVSTVAIDLPGTEISINESNLTPIEDISCSLSTDALDSLENDITNDINSAISNISPQPPIKEYKVNKFKRTWFERDSKTNLENEKPLENITELNDFEDCEPLIKKPVSISGTSLSNSHEKIKPKSNKTSSNNSETTSNIISYSSADSILDAGSNNGNLDEKQIKLVISKKKGSIFKSRALVAEQGGLTAQEKKRHTYVHKWDAKEEQEALANAAAAKNLKNEQPQKPVVEKSDTMDYDEEDDQPLALATRKKPQIRQIVTNSTNNKLNDNMDLAPGQTKVEKNTKEYYTVIRNVKTAHQIQEIGEYQEMDDDVEYILDTLQPRNPSSTRCLSALQLATKCMTPAFRMHVRAHGTVTKFFKALQDAKTDKSLGLCTAAIMFVLSQDTLNMDLDRDSLELMMNLLESDIVDSVSDSTNYERNKQKVRELCEEIKSHGKGAHLNIDSISAGTLAMETLLSLTSKRAGEWFKEELRELGGLEHIIKTICDCCHQISDYVVSWTEVLLEKLKTIERCLRVLENVSLLNEVNQTYILKYSNGHAVNTLFKLYKLCDSEIALYPTTDVTPKDNPGVVLREALVPTLKVLINLTHPFNDNALGSSILGQRKGIFDTSFHILLQAPNYVPERCIFELSILVLLLLINLTMHTLPNRQLIMQSHAPCDFGNQFDKQPAIKALIEYYYRCEEQARQAEKNTDAILDNPLEKKKAQSQEEFDETVTKLLQKAGHHMEHTLQASYAGILIGHLISDNKENEEVIRSYLKENSFNDIIKILDKYYNFMNLTASSEATVVSHIKSTKKLIDYYKHCESHSNNENQQEKNLNDSLEKKHHTQLNETVSTNDDDTFVSSSIEPTPSTSVSTRNNIRVYKTYKQR